MLRHRIAQGEFVAGGQLPTVAQLAEQYRLARITVRQAYAVLIAEGLITEETMAEPEETTESIDDELAAALAGELGVADLGADDE